MGLQHLWVWVTTNERTSAKGEDWPEGRRAGKVEFYARDLARFSASQALPAGKVSPLKIDLAQNYVMISDRSLNWRPVGGRRPTKPLPEGGVWGGVNGWQSPATKKRSDHLAASLFSSGGRTRTCDLRVMSPTSYRLLYPAVLDCKGRKFFLNSKIGPQEPALFTVREDSPGGK